LCVVEGVVGVVLAVVAGVPPPPDDAGGVVLAGAPPPVLAAGVAATGTAGVLAEEARVPPAAPGAAATSVGCPFSAAQTAAWAAVSEDPLLMTATLASTEHTEMAPSWAWLTRTVLNDCSA
jgi:hypothetical protein